MTPLSDYPHVLGTREDPHAQAREARRQPLLLHSMSVFREFFEIIFVHHTISTVVEVGVESGKVSGLFASLGASAVYCIEPHPTEEIRASLAANEALHLIEESSPEALADLPVADLYVLDGDHNYVVVRQELDWILTHAPDAVVVLHDLLWPWARRDLYYEPSRLSAAVKHPAGEDGPTVWHDDLTPAGFVGLGAYTTSVHAGGERNGVLTAVEDAIAHTEDKRWRFALIPAVFGMGVLIPETSSAATDLMHSLKPYCQSHLLAGMENNRIALYTRVLQLQYEAVARADDADRFAEDKLTQRREIERLEAELVTVTAQHAAEKRHLNRENARLAQLLHEQNTPLQMRTVLTAFRRHAAAYLRKSRLHSR
ncbi:MAG: class I SAM-dependent methyltransferase [Pseudonocardiaceae bacterium]